MGMKAELSNTSLEVMVFLNATLNHRIILMSKYQIQKFKGC